jgi:hypothetical protein
MDKGLPEPCPDSDVVFNGVHEWMTLKALKRRSGVIPQGWLELVETMHRERRYPEKAISAALTHLLDQGYIEKTDQGDGFSVRVPCPSEDFSLVFAGTTGAAGPQRDMIAAKPLTWRAVFGCERSEQSRYRVSERSDQKLSDQLPAPRNPRSPIVRLAREIFPSLCEEAGIEMLPQHRKWLPLSGHLRRWRERDGMEISLIRELMEEFVHHPEWCQPEIPPWRAFVRHRDKLMYLVEARRRRDPGNRRYSEGQDQSWWLDTPSQNRPTRGVEYWLGR